MMIDKLVTEFELIVEELDPKKSKYDRLMTIMSVFRKALDEAWERSENRQNHIEKLEKEIEELKKKGNGKSKSK